MVKIMKRVIVTIVFVISETRKELSTLVGGVSVFDALEQFGNP
jgi:hypothetical protein